MAAMMESEEEYQRRIVAVAAFSRMIIKRSRDLTEDLRQRQ